MNNNHKITAGESGVLAAVMQEPSGKLTQEMGCFILQTTPQALGRMALSLSRKNLIHRDSDGTIRLNTFESKSEDKSDPCPICNKPFKTCGHF